MTMLRRPIKRELRERIAHQMVVEITSRLGSSEKNTREPRGTLHGRAFTGRLRKFRRESIGLKARAIGSFSLITDFLALIPLLQRHYSCRKATMGSTFVARCAGM